MKVVDRAGELVAAVRRRSRLVDHGIAAVIHYTKMQGSVLAGAITYFGYLSVFPVLVLGFATVGFVTNGDRRATRAVTQAADGVLPGLIGERGGQLSLTSIQSAAGTVGVIGAVTLLYTGLNWLSAMRQSLQHVFTLPREAGRNFLLGKAVDLLALVVLGGVLLVSLGLSAAVTASSDLVLGWLSLRDAAGMSLLVRGVAIALGIVSSTALFFVMFRLLPNPELPSDALLRGAGVAAVGFEALKLVATLLIRLASHNPATAVLGTSVVLLVWINAFARVTILGASWAVTTGEAREALPELREEALAESAAESG